MDHILAKKEYTSRSALAIFTAFSLQIWTSIFLSMLMVFIVCLLSNIVKRNVNLKKQPKLSHCFFFILTSLFANSNFDHQSCRVWLLTALNWTVCTMFLKNLIANDLVTETTLGNIDDSIDTFTELAYKTNASISVFTGAVESNVQAIIEAYIPKRWPFHGRLTERLHLLEIEKLFDYELVLGILQRVSEGKEIHLTMDHTAKYYLNNWADGKFSDRIHVSEEFGDYMPDFLMTSPYSQPGLIKAKKFV